MKMIRSGNLKLKLVAAFVAVLGVSSAAAASGINLAGTWRFGLDRADVGVSEQWFAKDLADTIKLPGALQHQGYGDPISTDTPWVAKLVDLKWYTKDKYARYTQPGNVLVPFFLQPDRHYLGPAWYQRDIDVPAGWKARRVVLTLERPHWQTHVWLDDRAFGTNRSLGMPHVYDLGTGIAPGRHRLTIRVDNRMIVDVGADAHSISDETQTCWNGIIGRMDLTATSPVWLADVQVFPNVAKRSATLRVKVGNATGSPGKGALSAGAVSRPVAWDPNGASAELEVPLAKEAGLWDEFHPVLHKVTVRIRGDQADDVRKVTFGLREVGTSGLALTMNGRPFLARGTLECCVFPLTGYPAMDAHAWLRIFRVCREYGLNHMRFHSWCPPDAAFVAADELGFYLQVECGIWARAGARLGYGDPVDAWLSQETDAILRAYGNHPSFVFMAHGNEPSARPEFLAAWVKALKEKDGRRLYTSATGWGQTSEDQFDAAMAVVRRQTPNIRGDRGWRGKDYSDGTASAKVPILSHEIGQFCAYPDFDQIPKYRGALQPGNLEIFRDFAEASGTLAQNRQISRASGRLQVLCYKEEIEAALRTKGLAGFQLLDLHDFPGQGTALIGVLDAFWDSKGYVRPAEYRRFCNTTVPLARFAKRVFTSAEAIDVPLEISHFGPAPLEDAEPYWRLVDAAGRRVAGGLLRSRTIPIGNGTGLGQVHIDFSRLAAPAEYRLVVGLKATRFENDWSLWLYPAAEEVAIPEGLTVATELDARVIAELETGGRVILFPSQIAKAHPPVSFVPIFWNNQLFPNEKKQTLGMLCNPKSPMLAQFPTREHSEWNWEDILRGSRAFDLAGQPLEMRPLIQIIDDWNTGRKLALTFECKVGSGRLLVCGADLPQLAERSPAARQLYQSMLAYAAGDRFDPAVSLSAGQIHGLISTAASKVLSPQGDRPLTDLAPNN